MSNNIAANDFGISEKFQIPKVLWEIIEPLLPEPKLKKKSGRPRMDDKKAMTAILYVLRTGIQWNALPRSLGASSTVHDRFSEWTAEGVFELLWQAVLIKYDEEKGLDWEWQAMDGAMVKAPLGKKGLPRRRRQPHRPGKARHEAEFAYRG